MDLRNIDMDLRNTIEKRKQCHSLKLWEGGV